MTMLSSFNKLKKSKEFLNWKNKNKNSYLSSCFTILEESKNDWQFDFYLPSLDKITSFTVNDKIKIQEEEAIFSKEKTKINKLNLDEVKISFDQVLEIINKKYKKKFTKKIIILQNLDKLVWNISLLDNELNIINIRIDAVNGKIVSEKKESLLKFKSS